MNQPELTVMTESKNVRIFLSMIENHNLVNLLLAEYASSGMADTDFADYAMTKIKLRPGVTIKDHTIKARRDQFKIPANRAKAPMSADNEGLVAAMLAGEKRITDLEERVTMLEAWINTTFPNKGPRKAI